MTTTPSTLSGPIALADLPLPADLARQAAEHCRYHGYKGSERIYVEDELKLSYYYAGKFVVATPGPHGLLIHAVDPEGPDQLDELTSRLRAQGHCNVICLYPNPPNDPYFQTLPAEPP